VGYVSAFRPGGFGDFDIYRVRFNDHAQITRIITGKIYLGDSVSAQPTSSPLAAIMVKNKATNEEYMFVPHPKTGKYVIALGAGTYGVNVVSEGYVKQEEILNISDLGTVVEMEKNRVYVLKKDPNYVKKSGLSSNKDKQQEKDKKPKDKK